MDSETRFDFYRYNQNGEPIGLSSKRNNEFIEALYEIGYIFEFQVERNDIYSYVHDGHSSFIRLNQGDIFKYEFIYHFDIEKRFDDFGEDVPESPQDRFRLVHKETKRTTSQDLYKEYIGLIFEYALSEKNRARIGSQDPFIRPLVRPPGHNFDY